MRSKQPAKLASGTVREPVRIVVGGSSASLLVTPPRTRRDEGNYGELLPRLLAAHGIVAESRHTGQWFGMIRDFRRRYEQAVRNQFPDVFILNFGIAEAEPNFLPTWLARHLTSWDLSSAPIPVFYRRHFAPMLWRLLRSYQRFMSRLTANHSWRLSPSRFAREMQRVIELAREETGCLVLVLDIDPPGERVCHWMPGMWQRWERYQRVLQRLIAALDDPEVRLIPNAATILDELGFEAALPDGFHRSAAGHARTAELLADEILQWLGQPAEPYRKREALSARAVARQAGGQ